MQSRIKSKPMPGVPFAMKPNTDRDDKSKASTSKSQSKQQQINPAVAPKSLDQIAHRKSEPLFRERSNELLQKRATPNRQSESQA
jgi:hypothetical protein